LLEHQPVTMPFLSWTPFSGKYHRTGGCQICTVSWPPRRTVPGGGSWLAVAQGRLLPGRDPIAVTAVQFLGAAFGARPSP
jgi:hypothetical protein